MGIHLFCVDTGIGTSCANGVDLGCENRRQRFFNRFLYGHCIKLRLPTVIMRTVICKFYEISQTGKFILMHTKILNKTILSLRAQRNKMLRLTLASGLAKKRMPKFTPASFNCANPGETRTGETYPHNEA